jgi:hypothetical protein
MSSGVSRTLAAPTFSARWARLPVPGTGSTTGEAASSAAAARRLGTSLRTYRRRVAELMAALEAGSRRLAVNREIVDHGRVSSCTAPQFPRARAIPEP